jgi:hypothetical protein
MLRREILDAYSRCTRRRPTEADLEPLLGNPQVLDLLSRAMEMAKTFRETKFAQAVGFFMATSRISTTFQSSPTQQPTPHHPPPSRYNPKDPKKMGVLFPTRLRADMTSEMFHYVFGIDEDLLDPEKTLTVRWCKEFLQQKGSKLWKEWNRSIRASVALEVVEHWLSKEL